MASRFQRARGPVPEYRNRRDNTSFTGHHLHPFSTTQADRTKHIPAVSACLLYTLPDFAYSAVPHTRA